MDHISVCHLVSGDLSHGAARGALWLHQGLLREGVGSEIISDTQTGKDLTRVTAPPNLTHPRLARFLRGQADQLLLRLYKNRKRWSFSTGWPGINFLEADAYKNAEILHLHWINRGFVNLRHLAAVKKPIVWTMRDMWPMTGGCHYSMDCSGFTQTCGRCPQLGSSRQHDLSHFILKRKIKHLPKSITLVGISEWLSDSARKSTLFRCHDIRTIPNCIDLQEFFPVDRRIARDVLRLPQGRKIVLAGAFSLESYYKGLDALISALNQTSGTFHVVFFGNLSESSVANLKAPWQSLGFLHDNVTLRLLYSAADVFVATSRMEGLGKTLIESLACGTPVVAFGATGILDVVTHQLDGYLAEPFSTEDLANGIRWILEHDSPQTLSRAAREKAKCKFSQTSVARQYRGLYEQLLSAAHGGTPISRTSN